ncbi:hypothetical protein IMZ48_10175 [Candidatus Bathyarchaeota archaeon]|nr:hypothetical protein [Candidatus Bathyarchaeota archaeon]
MKITLTATGLAVLVAVTTAAPSKLPPGGLRTAPKASDQLKDYVEGRTNDRIQPFRDAESAAKKVTAPLPTASEAKDYIADAIPTAEESWEAYLKFSEKSFKHGPIDVVDPIARLAGKGIHKVSGYNINGKTAEVKNKGKDIASGRFNLQRPIKPESVADLGDVDFAEDAEDAAGPEKRDLEDTSLADVDEMVKWTAGKHAPWGDSYWGLERPEKEHPFVEDIEDAATPEDEKRDLEDPSPADLYEVVEWTAGEKTPFGVPEWGLERPEKGHRLPSDLGLPIVGGLANEWSEGQLESFDLDTMDMPRHGGYGEKKKTAEEGDRPGLESAFDKIDVPREEVDRERKVAKGKASYRRGEMGAEGGDRSGLMEKLKDVKIDGMIERPKKMSVDELREKTENGLYDKSLKDAKPLFHPLLESDEVRRELREKLKGKNYGKGKKLKPLTGIAAGVGNYRRGQMGGGPGLGDGAEKDEDMKEIVEGKDPRNGRWGGLGLGDVGEIDDIKAVVEGEDAHYRRQTGGGEDGTEESEGMGEVAEGNIDAHQEDGGVEVDIGGLKGGIGDEPDDDKSVGGGVNVGGLKGGLKIGGKKDKEDRED